MKFFFFLLLIFALPAVNAEQYYASFFQLEYAQPNAHLPSIQTLQKVVVQLGRKENAFVDPSESAQQVRLPFHQLKAGEYDVSALRAISRDLVRALNQSGLSGVRVSIDPSQINREGEDVRPPGQDALTFIINTSQIGHVRTIKKGAQPELDELDAKQHQHIAQYAPAKTGDNLRQNALEDYVFYLNRHANRRVDLEVGGLGAPGLATVDFIITEDKPWRVYTNVANTGPDTIEQWQQIFGYINTQLTNFDDIFILDFATDSFQDYYSVVVSYDRPFASYRRLRWNIEGQYRQFDAAQLGFGDLPFRGEFWEAELGFDLNIYQRRDFFIDLFYNNQYNYIHVNNGLTGIKGHQGFFIPEIGARLNRVCRTSVLYLESSWQGPINGVTGVSQSELNRLGRNHVNLHWSVWNGTAFGSCFLESLFQGDHYSCLANEIFVYTQWQYAFNNRLIPEYENVIGGLYSVRGYPTAAIAGDSTIIATAEYRLHLAQLAKPRQGRRLKVAPAYPGDLTDWDYIVRLFYDIGAVSVKQNRKSERDPTGTLMGIGIGGELIFRQNIFFRTDFAWALKSLNNPTAENIPSGNFEPYLSITLMY